jgi:surface antigen Omp85-like protein/WD40 repeat protein
MCSVRALGSLLILLGLCAAAPPTASAAGRYDPRLRFRTTRTSHFDIHAHQGEEAMARRLAGIVERVRTKFEPAFGVAHGRVQVILVDQTDLSNGWATPLPYDTIEITAVPPSPETLIGNTTDWLELVFTHEYTHILHLDRSRGLMQRLRRVFGRVPAVFPNGFLPIWQVEGIATFEESRMTGEGRIPAGDFRAIVDVAAAQGRFEPIDRAGGGLIDWPQGYAPYAYGAYFHQYLADRYGPESLVKLADATAGRVPLFGAGAFKKVFGRSPADLWDDFREARETAAAPRSGANLGAQRLTHHGFVVTAPRVADGGAIYYGVANAGGYPALMELTPGGVPRRVAWRGYGNRTSVRGDWIVFDQLERVRSVALYSDLYAVRRAGDGAGRVRRLTKDARAGDPDLSPDARRIVCTLQATGRRALAVLDFPAAGLATPRLLIDDPDADYTGPRWSPDGGTIVAERRRRGVYELVLIDPVSRAVRVLAARSDARLVTPAWTPDGATVLFSANVGDKPFNVFAVDVASGAVRQVTDTAGGAQFPELSANGSLFYVGYSPDGYDLFSLPAGSFRLKAEATRAGETEPTGEKWRAEVPEQPADGPLAASRGLRLLDRRSRGEGGQAEGTDQSYNPWRTLLPTFWTPMVETDSGETLIGAATAVVDALGRHAYSVDAGWAGGRVRPDWHAAYAYDRWRPTLVASYSDDTDPIRGGTFRSREVVAGAQLPFRHLRWTETLFAGFDALSDTVTCAEIMSACRTRAAARELRSLRGGWLHNSRRSFGYSISPEEGFSIAASAETSRTLLGSDANAAATVLDARGYHRVFGPHTVLAGRFGMAAAWGPVGARRAFSAGGSGPSEAAFDFGRDAIGLLRGFASGHVSGSHAAVANLDLRFPLARVQRGAGSWPVFFQTVHAATFFDAGHAWDTALRTGGLRTSTGAELSLDLVILHYVPLTLVTGAAWTRDPVAHRQRAAFFGRIGHAF